VKDRLRKSEFLPKQLKISQSSVLLIEMKYIKFFAFVLTLVSFFAFTLLLYPFKFIAPHLTRKIISDFVSFHASMILMILQVKVNVRNETRLLAIENSLIVSNHLSYLDVLVLAAILPSCFVTSKEIKNSIFLGQIVTLAGCLFVDRKNKSNLKGEISELRAALSAGLNVTIFPEATSTNGSEVLRFKRPLFESAIATARPILPFTINYTNISSESVSANNRDIVCWYGEMEFFPHFLKLLDQTSISVEVQVHEPFYPKLLPTMDLAIKSHQIVSQSYRPINNEILEAF
jgi:1-acyl-sn-glycerol-3-phosphate acyltransferase